MSFKFRRNFPSYKAGQFTVMDLQTKEDPEGPSRCFTIASSPTEKEILISTRIRDTPFKQKLANLEIGAHVDMKEPEGDFVLHEDTTKTAVMVSGGIGVTPFRSMIKFVTDQKLETKIVMFDSNRSEANILYKNEFDKCLNINKNLKIIYTVTDVPPNNRKILQGRVDKSMITKHLGESDIENSIFYLCGPPGLVGSMQKLLKEDLAIPENKIKTEEFTGY